MVRAAFDRLFRQTALHPAFYGGPDVAAVIGRLRPDAHPSFNGMSEGAGFVNTALLGEEHD